VPIVGLVLKTPEQGARTSVYLASSPDVEGVNGKYYVDCREHRSSTESYDQDAARNLWEVSAKIAGVGA
jgi:retinol dehydrogenase-14